MKRLVFLTMILMHSLMPVAFSQNRSISFVEKPFNDLLALAKAQNKLIFLDGYTTWCGPCKWIAANMFTRDSVADLYNNTFICAHFDMEKGEGIEIARAFHVRAYPTLLFIDGNGVMVHMRVGAPRQVKDFVEMAREALTPGEGFADCIKEYQGGNRNPVFLVRYFDRMEKAYLPVGDPLNNYLDSLQEDEMLSRGTWNIMNRFLSDIDSKGFGFLLKHRSDYARRYTRDSVWAKISDVYSQALNNALRHISTNATLYDDLKKKIRDGGFEDAGKILFIGDLNLARMKGQQEQFIRIAVEGTDKYLSNDYQSLNTIAREFYQLVPGGENLEKAASWAKQSIALQSMPENNSTYANILFKMGKRNEAIRYANKALELARANNIPTKDYEETLRKFQAK